MMNNLLPQPTYGIAPTSRTLTDFELIGLNSEANLADGHAYHDTILPYFNILTGLPLIWEQAKSISIPEMELRFKRSFSKLIMSSALNRIKNFKIAPTASNTIDIIGAFLRASKYKTALIEPTFDNLSLLLKRREVDLVSLASQELSKIYNGGASTVVDDPSLGAIFLVNPNNPTGSVIGPQELIRIADYCIKHGKLLILDNSFRLFSRTIYDDYQILTDSKVSFIAFEDTGKSFPTQDMKASLLLYSEDNKVLVEKIYNELYLCTSNFQLAVLIEFFEATARTGLPNALWTLVDERRQALREVLDGTRLKIDSESKNSDLSVEWLNCGRIGSDIFVCDELQKSGLVILPGRNFYWNSSHLETNRRNVRLSLLKDARNFERSLNIIRTYLKNEERISPY